MKFDATPYINPSFTIDNQFCQQAFIEGPYKAMFGKFNEKDVGLVLDVTAQEISDHYKELLELELLEFHQTATEYAVYLEANPEEEQRFASFQGASNYERVYSNIMLAHKYTVQEEMIKWTLSHVTVDLKEKTMLELNITYLRLADELKATEELEKAGKNLDDLSIDLPAESNVETTHVQNQIPPTPPSGE